MIRLIPWLWTVRSGAVLVIAPLLLATPVHAIQMANPDYDYWHRTRALDSKYDAIVSQYAYNTSLQTTEKDGRIIRWQFTVDANASSYSTAVLVDPQYVITAAHTVNDYGYFQYEIGGELYLGQQWWTPATTDPDALPDFSRDMAIVRLDRPVTNVTPLQYNNHLTRSQLDGQEVEIIGLGSTNAVGDPTGFLTGGMKRYARNRLDVSGNAAFLNQSLDLMFDLDLANFTPPIDPVSPWDPKEVYPLVLEGGLLPGDSGGAIMVGDTVVGINSYIYGVANDSNQDPQFGYFSAGMDVGRFAGWIGAVVEDQDARLEPQGLFGYNTGVMGIKIEDILADIQKEKPILVPELDAGGLLDFYEGTPIWDPVEKEWDFSLVTGLGSMMGTGPFSLDIDPETARPSVNPYWQNAAWTGNSGAAEIVSWSDSSYFNEAQEARLLAFTEGLAMMGLNAQEIALFLDLNGIDNIVNSDEDPASWGTWSSSLWDNMPREQKALVGDLNLDGIVGQGDLNLVLQFWGQESTGDILFGDASGDGFVGQDDINIILHNWGNGSVPGAQVGVVAVPEPASVAFLGLGAVAMLRRRRR